MLKNAYLDAKIGVDPAENEQTRGEVLEAHPEDALDVVGARTSRCFCCKDFHTRGESSWSRRRPPVSCSARLEKFVKM